jgi:hypothetical protein
VIEADFVKVFFNTTSNTFQTQDSFLANKKIFCDFNHGLCADTRFNSHDHVSLISNAFHSNLGIFNLRTHYPNKYSKIGIKILIYDLINYSDEH